MKVKEESEKVGLKLNIQKTKIMASGPITSWEIDGKQWKQCQTIFLGSKITADGDCCHEIKRRLLLGRKVMTNLDQIRSVAQSCPTLCDPMNRSKPGLPVPHRLPEFTHTHVHRVSDAIQPSHPRYHIEKQRYYLANKIRFSQDDGFSSGHVWMRDLECEES